MRALVITHNFPRHAGDPVGSFVLRLVRALGEQGITSRVVAPAAPDLPAEDTVEGVPVSRFRYAPRGLETLAYTGTMGAQVRRSWKARLAMAGILAAGYRAATRVIERHGADIVHAHWWFPAGLIARAVRTRRGIPYVVTMHGSDIRLALGTRASWPLFRAVSSRAAAMTTVSTWLAEAANELDPAVSPLVAPMPVRVELFHPPASGERDERRLLFIGKLTEQKGLHHLLHAMSHMRNRPMLDVVGAGRVRDDALRALAGQLGLTDRITWHPLLSQEELAVLYRKAAVHVIPAVDEGLGMSAVESLLSETPVVAFASGGLTDIVRSGQTGILTPPGDRPALAAAVDSLLDDRARRERFGREGRAWALEHFSPEQVAARYAAVLRNAAGASALRT